MHFSIWMSKDDQFYWEIKGDNGEIMAVSETYTTKAAAKHAIGVVQKGADTATVLDHTDGDSRYDRDLP